MAYPCSTCMLMAKCLDVKDTLTGFQKFPITSYTHVLPRTFERLRELPQGLVYGAIWGLYLLFNLWECFGRSKSLYSHLIHLKTLKQMLSQREERCPQENVVRQLIHALLLR